MSCQEWIAEIVECARAGQDAPPALGAHLSRCPDCADRFDAERWLTGRMRMLRDAVADERSSPMRRARLMAEFDERHSASRRQVRRWLPIAAAAAVTVLAVALSWRTPAVTPPAATAPQEIADDNGFVAVPYAPPLAAGEYVRVVRTDLYAAALDRMGISVPFNSAEFRADVVMGEDGLPRAVRLVASDSVSN